MTHLKFSSRRLILSVSMLLLFQTTGCNDIKPTDRKAVGMFVETTIPMRSNVDFAAKYQHRAGDDIETSSGQLNFPAGRFVSSGSELNHDFQIDQISTYFIWRQPRKFLSTETHAGLSWTRYSLDTMTTNESVLNHTKASFGLLLGGEFNFHFNPKLSFVGRPTWLLSPDIGQFNFDALFEYTHSEELEFLGGWGISRTTESLLLTDPASTYEHLEIEMIASGVTLGVRYNY